jgi:hypothetical protein
MRSRGASGAVMNNLIQRGIGVVSRYFTDLQSSLSQHYTMNTFTFAQDETLSIDFATTSTGNEEALLGDNPSAHALLIRTDGKIELVGATTVVFNSVVTDGLLNTFEIVRTGTGVEGFLNGVTDGTGTISGDITFTRIAAQAANFLNGIVSRFTKDFTHELRFDEDLGSTTTVINLGSIGASGNATAVNITDSDLFTQVDDGWLGVDVWDGADLDTSDASTTVVINTSGSSWDVSSTDGAPSNNAHGGRIFDANSTLGLIAGESYILSVVSTNPVNLAIYDSGFTLMEFVSDGTDVQFVATATTRLYVCPRDTSVTTITNAVVKRLIEVAT